jgi:hypothetical protein
LDEERNTYRPGAFREQQCSWHDGRMYCIHLLREEWHLARYVAATVAGVKVPVLLEWELHGPGMRTMRGVLATYIFILIYLYIYICTDVDSYIPIYLYMHRCI